MQKRRNPNQEETNKNRPKERKQDDDAMRAAMAERKIPTCKLTREKKLIK